MRRGTRSSRPSAPARLPAEDPAQLDRWLHDLLGRTADHISPPAYATARLAVRRRLRQLHRRRRRLRHTVGSSTLAVGALAGGLQLRFAGGPGGPGPLGSPPAAHPDEGQPTGGPAGTGPDHAWTWDPDEGAAREAADPGALHAEGRFHVYTTSAVHCVAGACRDHWVPRFGAADLAGPGRLEGDAMPDRPAWVDPADRAIWAPAPARVGPDYVLYFAATSGRPQDGGMKCLGVAVAGTPDGPFAPRAEPLSCTPGYWSIDPYPVRAGDRWYLLWRQDDGGNRTGMIVAAPLRDDGLGLGDAGSGPVEPVALMAGQYRWEEGHPWDGGGIGPVENPAMARHPATGAWLLTWSANRWETQDYATGLAICDGPMGPCHRTSQEAWLRSSADPAVATGAAFGGAGGLSFVAGPADGDDSGEAALYAVLHAYHGTGHHPAPRLGWAFRVEAEPGDGYRLVDAGGASS